MSREADGAAAFLALVGPTASGKTEAALQVAEALGAEILSVDSMLVYRGMDVGTAKPTAEQRARVPHHLLDLVEPSEPFSVAAFQAAARAAADGVRRRGRRPLLVGGSGLYFRAVVDDLEFPGTEPEVRGALEDEAAALGPARMYRRLVSLDPVAASRIEPGNVRRTVRALEVAAITGRPLSSYAAAWERYEPGRVRVAGVRLSTEDLGLRIAARVDGMLAEGWLEEVRSLVDAGFGDWLTASQAIGYAELARHLAGELDLEDAVRQTVARTRALARRQMAWFRRDPRIRWFDAGSNGAAEVVDRIVAHLETA
ncbi:MAG TPA: tRNA (adenosine(37)-N6)-dimethylallyltransferase MiaA [Actinomycetota bacterium]|nr:tRNA (adenosine(37)-N6)-dimethylallyltransferase MiaA [Actinomycetota bacterium]